MYSLVIIILGDIIAGQDKPVFGTPYRRPVFRGRKSSYLVHANTNYPAQKPWLPIGEISKHYLTSRRIILTDTEAIKLIEGFQPAPVAPQYWADLGCGSGVFSRALASLLPGQSHILCIDKTGQNLITGSINNVKLEFKKADFLRYSFEGMKFDGLLMANSLHYVRDKARLIYTLAAHLQPGGIFLIIEYDTLRSNPWVPYPIDFDSLSALFNRQGYRHITKLGERKSIFDGRNIYACAIRL